MSKEEEFIVMPVLAPPRPRDTDALSPLARQLMNALEDEYKKLIPNFNELFIKDEPKNDIFNLSEIPFLNQSDKWKNLKITVDTGARRNKKLIDQANKNTSIILSPNSKYTDLEGVFVESNKVNDTTNSDITFPGEPVNKSHEEENLFSNSNSDIDITFDVKDDGNFDYSSDEELTNKQNNITNQNSLNHLKNIEHDDNSREKQINTQNQSEKEASKATESLKNNIFSEHKQKDDNVIHSKYSLPFFFNSNSGKPKKKVKEVQNWLENCLDNVNKSQTDESNGQENDNDEKLLKTKNISTNSDTSVQKRLENINGLSKLKENCDDTSSEVKNNSDSTTFANCNASDKEKNLIEFNKLKEDNPDKLSKAENNIETNTSTTSDTSEHKDPIKENVEAENEPPKQKRKYNLDRFAFIPRPKEDMENENEVAEKEDMQQTNEPEANKVNNYGHIIHVTDKSIEPTSDITNNVCLNIYTNNNNEITTIDMVGDNSPSMEFSNIVKQNIRNNSISANMEIIPKIITDNKVNTNMLEKNNNSFNITFSPKSNLEMSQKSMSCFEKPEFVTAENFIKEKTHFIENEDLESNNLEKCDDSFNVTFSPKTVLEFSQNSKKGSEQPSFENAGNFVKETGFSKQDEALELSHSEKCDDTFNVTFSPKTIIEFSQKSMKDSEQPNFENDGKSVKKTGFTKQDEALELSRSEKCDGSFNVTFSPKTIIKFCQNSMKDSEQPNFENDENSAKKTGFSKQDEALETSRSEKCDDSFNVTFSPKISTEFSQNKSNCFEQSKLKLTKYFVDETPLSKQKNNLDTFAKHYLEFFNKNLMTKEQLEQPVVNSFFSFKENKNSNNKDININNTVQSINEITQNTINGRQDDEKNYNLSAGLQTVNKITEHSVQNDFELPDIIEKTPTPILKRNLEILAKRHLEMYKNTINKEKFGFKVPYKASNNRLMFEKDQTYSNNNSETADKCLESNKNLQTIVTEDILTRHNNQSIVQNKKDMTQDNVCKDSSHFQNNYYRNRNIDSTKLTDNFSTISQNTKQNDLAAINSNFLITSTRSLNTSQTGIVNPEVTSFSNMENKKKFANAQFDDKILNKTFNKNENQVSDKTFEDKMLNENVSLDENTDDWFNNVLYRNDIGKKKSEEEKFVVNNYTVEDPKENNRSQHPFNNLHKDVTGDILEESNNTGINGKGKFLFGKNHLEGKSDKSTVMEEPYLENLKVKFAANNSLNEFNCNVRLTASDGKEYGKNNVSNNDNINNILLNDKINCISENDSEHIQDWFKADPYQFNKMNKLLEFNLEENENCNTMNEDKLGVNKGNTKIEEPKVENPIIKLMDCVIPKRGKKDTKNIKTIKRKGYIMEVDKSKAAPQPKTVQTKITSLLKPVKNKAGNTLAKEKVEQLETTTKETVEMKITEKSEPKKRKISDHFPVIKRTTDNNKIIENDNKKIKIDSEGQLPKYNKRKQKFFTPLLSQFEEKNVQFHIYTLDDKMCVQLEKYLIENRPSEIGFDIIYKDGFSLLNHPRNSYTLTNLPLGIMIYISWQTEKLNKSSFTEFYFLKLSQSNWNSILTPKSLIKTCLTINCQKACFKVNLFFIALLKIFSFASSELSVIILDPFVGCWLLDPDHPPTSFQGVQTQLKSRPSYKITSTDVLEISCDMLIQLSQTVQELKKTLEEKNLWTVFDDMEMKIVSILAVMEHHGISVDVNELKNLSKILKQKLEIIEEKAYECAGRKFQINSTVQIRAILYDELKLDAKNSITVKETATLGAKSTSEPMLNLLRTVHPLPGLILEYRHLHKAKSTFVDSMMQHIKNGYIYSSWEQTAAATGRITANNPNLQAIPKQPFPLVLFPENADLCTDEILNLRSPYNARSGYTLVAADFQHIELRVFAHLTQDNNIITALNEPGDIFVTLAKTWLGNTTENISKEYRDQTKKIVYATMYGAGYKKLADILSISAEEASQIIKDFNTKFPSLREFTRQTIERCRIQGYLISLSGRRRLFPNINSPIFGLKSQSERQAVNFIIQGSAADICKAAMISTTKRLKGFNSRLLLQIHDELVWEVADEEIEQVKPIVKEVMEDINSICGNLIKLSVPFPVSITSGKNWAKMI